MVDFGLTILGNNSAVPAHGRHPTAQVLRHDGDQYLIDCGEGTQFRMQETGIRQRGLDTIFISHLHGDHFYGLFGLLNTVHLLSRSKPLTIFGPAGLDAMLNAVLGDRRSRMRFDLIVHEISDDEPTTLVETDRMVVSTLPLVHRIPTTGFLFRERTRPAHIRPEAIRAHGIPHERIEAIRRGADFERPDGTVITHADLTTPAEPPRSYAYCSDTAFHEELIDRVNGVDLLYHEATFLAGQSARAAETFHSTAEQAARIAHAAGVGRLVLGHFSSRYDDLSPVLAEARAIFPRTELGLEGTTFDVRI